MFKKVTKDAFIGKLNVSDAYRRKIEPIAIKLSMDNYCRQENKEAIELLAKDNAILDEIYSSLNSKQVEFIKDQMKESEGGHHFKILSEKPDLPVEFEKEDNNSFNVFVEQWNEYPCEDCYSGYVYVEIIKNKKYLKWSYSM